MACDKCREEMGLSPESELAPEYGTNEARDFELYPELFPELEQEMAPASVPPNRSSREYVAWMQAALNRALGLQLKADGVMGTRTRSAIRSFQQRSGIKPDGVVGPTTEAALKAVISKASTGPTGQWAPAPPSPATSVGIGGSKVPMFFGLDTYSGDENKNPDWVKARAEGPISFAIIKANEGEWRDPSFDREWPRIKNAGIVRGAYLFLRFPHPKYRFQAPDPVAQANLFIRIIQMVGELDQSDLPPSLDVEFPDGQAKTRMTPQQLLEGVRAAWRVLKDHYRVAPIIYTSARVWQEDLKNLPAPDLVESPLWLAKPYLFREHTPARRNPEVFGPGGRKYPPRVPPPWGDATNWWIHQYQGDAHGLPGLRQVDMNRS